MLWYLACTGYCYYTNTITDATNVTAYCLLLLSTTCCSWEHMLMLMYTRQPLLDLWFLVSFCMFHALPVHVLMNGYCRKSSVVLMVPNVCVCVHAAHCPIRLSFPFSLSSLAFNLITRPTFFVGRQSWYEHCLAYWSTPIFRLDAE